MFGQVFSPGALCYGRARKTMRVAWLAAGLSRVLLDVIVRPVCGQTGRSPKEGVGGPGCEGERARLMRVAIENLQPAHVAGGLAGAGREFLAVCLGLLTTPPWHGT